MGTLNRPEDPSEKGTGGAERLWRLLQSLAYWQVLRGYQKDLGYIQLLAHKSFQEDGHSSKQIFRSNAREAGTQLLDRQSFQQHSRVDKAFPIWSAVSFLGPIQLLGPQ